MVVGEPPRLAPPDPAREGVAPGTAAERPATGRPRAMRPGPAATWAAGVWAIGLPASLLFVTLVDANPLTSRGSVLPVAAGLVAGLVIFGLVARRLNEATIGVAAGGYATWVGLTLFAAHQGTPFGESGLWGDAGRLAAMATRFTEHWGSTDMFVPSVPSEYPPLYPWLLGRLSTVIDQPAWQLIGYGDAVLASAAVLVAFLLWRPLVPSSVALVLAVIPPWVFGSPSKSYEIVVLAATLPWLLRTFGDRDRADHGLHWLPAGLIGGLMIQTYQGFLVFASLGLVAFVIWTARTSARRSGYLRHVALVVVTMLIVAAWYVGPYVYASITLGGSRVNDLFVSTGIVDDPVGVRFLYDRGLPLGLLVVSGLVGLVWYFRTRWWARPLALLVAGAYAFRWIFVVIFVSNGHTLYLHYTSRLIEVILASAGVLTLVNAVPVLARPVTTRSLRPVALLGATMTMVVAALAGRALWMPTPFGLGEVVRPTTVPQNLQALAHAEWLPDGRAPRYAVSDPRARYFPAQQVKDAVERVLGPGADPVTVCYEERLFAYYPWTGYVAVERTAANTWTHWEDRRAELLRLAALRDPAQFAAASRDTRFGGIDVFVLRADPDGWTWNDVRFNREQFGAGFWTVVDDLPTDTVVVVRVPGT